ncbi:MAG: DUF1848 family protein, partial [Firmicutes bacterium]|nr:DUF1848 family protein [Bacillota bacterium]
ARISWRYDPVLLTGEYTIRRHKETFAYLCSRLNGHVDRCIFNFVELYKKLSHNMPELIMLTDAAKDELAASFGETARRYGLRLQTCGAAGDFRRYGIHPSGCVTLDILGRANGVQFRNLKHRGARPGCRCIESRDIGAYDTCPNGCRYCYANQNPVIAAENYRRHDPDSPLLFGALRETDVIRQGSQASFLTRDHTDGQMTLDWR